MAPEVPKIEQLNKTTNFVTTSDESRFVRDCSKWNVFVTNPDLVRSRLTSNALIPRPCLLLVFPGATRGSCLSEVIIRIDWSQVTLPSRYTCLARLSSSLGTWGTLNTEVSNIFFCNSHAWTSIPAWTTTKMTLCQIMSSWEVESILAH